VLRHYRRYWAPLSAFLLALPLLVGALTSGGKPVSSIEARSLAPTPAFPEDFAAWGNFPRQTDAYLRDHFGLRQIFLRAYGYIMSRGPFQTGNPMVLAGANGRMFFRGDQMVQQSAGLLRRDEQVAQTADLLARMHALLAARGTRMLVASPPNSATIYADQLPLWARNRGQRTEYDVFLDDLAARGVPAIDLRPALIAAKADGKVYRMNDTHWTALGAVTAFNVIVQADSHPDWKLDPARVLGASETIVGGDLARMLGTADNMKETDRLSALPPGKREALDKVKENTTALATSDRSGPTIMIIGDSFTGDFFLSMLLQNTGRVVWLHHSFCGFDWKWIDQLRPDEVWWMPTERFIPCGKGGVRPVGLPPADIAGAH
jgi:alginate O-acetyltransferase complex protein AlgJ